MANKVHWKLLNANSVQFFFSTHLLRPPWGSLAPPPRGSRPTLWEPLDYDTRQTLGLVFPQLVQKCPALYESRCLIIVFTRVRKWSLSRGKLIQSAPIHLPSIRTILILSSHLRVSIPRGLFSSDFQTKLCDAASRYVAYVFLILSSLSLFSHTSHSFPVFVNIGLRTCFCWKRSSSGSLRLYLSYCTSSTQMIVVMCITFLICRW
jgi:hypothetical protein